MGTPHDHHPGADEAEKSPARRLRTEQREPLARAKENLKDRLLKKITQEALDELQGEAFLDTLAADAPAEALSTLKEALQARWLEEARQRAVEVLPGDPEALPAPDAATLQPLKDAYTARLTEQVCREAREALHADDLPDLEADALDALKDAYTARITETVRSQALDALEADEVHGAVAEELPARFEEIKEAVTAQLVAELARQIVEEITPDAVAASLEQAAPEQAGALEAVKETLKGRLLDQLFQEAVAEIDDEADSLAVGDFAEAAGPEEEKPDPEASAEEPAPAAGQAGDPALIDMHFWEKDEDGHVDGLLEAYDQANEPAPPDMPTPLAPPSDETEEDDSPFFLPIDSDAPGDDTRDEWPEPDAEERDAELPEEAEAPPVVYYLYGLFTETPTDPENALPEAGIDEEYPVYVIAQDTLFGVVSEVAAAEFGQEALAINNLDPAWTAERTEAHEAVVEHLKDNPTFLPVPFCTTFETEDDVRTMLSDLAYQEEMQRLHRKFQWTLRLHRDRETLHQRVVENSDAVKELMAEIKQKPKGGTASIKKKMVATIQEEMALVTDNCTREVHERLLLHADDIELGVPEDAPGEAKGEVIMAAAYLVHEDTATRFEQGVEGLQQEFGELGFTLEVEGPASPSRFARFLSAR